MICASAAAGEVRVPKTGLSVVLKGTDDRDLAAWVLPLGSGLRLSLGAPYAAQAAVFVRELGSTSPFLAELFVRHYGVTPDECRLLMALVQGMTLKDAADTLGIAHATAKSHLARLFQKTGSERQADLVQLAMTALAPGYSVNGPSADCSQLQPCDRLPSLRQDKRIAVLGFRCVPKRAQGRIWGSCAAQRRRLTPNRRRMRSGSLVLADGLR